MRYPATEKLEIIRLVEQSHLSARQTLDKLGIPRPTFYRWYDRFLTHGVEELADRTTAPLRVVELAWLWLRHQPKSTLTLWFKDRIARNAGRLKTPMIVALARKLLVALWKYVSSGIVIEGAIMKAA